MRVFAVGLFLFSTAPVLAADYGDTPLRGSQTYVPGHPTYFRWSGVYGGAQAGYTAGNLAFGRSVSGLVSQILRDSVLQSDASSLTALSNQDDATASFGGFVGYNMQWDEAVLGVELNYNSMDFNKGAVDSISRTFANDTNAPPDHHFFYAVTVDGAATVKITDIATLRSRAGWVFDQFMPYGFVGLAVARADVQRIATVSYVRTDIPNVTNPVTPPIAAVVFGPQSAGESQTGGFYFGYAAGVGIDIALLPNVFVRGEWEWVQIPDIKEVRVNLNSIRGAIGVKF